MAILSVCDFPIVIDTNTTAHISSRFCPLMAFKGAASYVVAIKTLRKRYLRSRCQMKALDNGWGERVDKGVTITYAFPCQLKLSHLSLRY